MHFVQISVENFRNIALGRLALCGESQFLLGANAQGKTNLLEAVSLLSALRSFRTSDNRSLIAQGQKQARLLCRCEHEQLGQTEVLLTLEPGSKTLLHDGEKITRLADFLGLLPTVALSSEDIQLLRGAPALRRRLLDLILSSASAEYFTALRRYHRALGERNSALKALQKGGSAAMVAAAGASAAAGATSSAAAGAASARATADAVLSSFEKVMAAEAARIVAVRASSVTMLSDLLLEAYQRISPEPESPALRYEPDSEAAARPEEFTRLLAKNRERDAILGSTQRGPHRDDFALLLQGRPARQYASEGQQRGLVLALRLAQAEFVQAARGILPVLLADDIIGELDPVRREGFWRTLGTERQVIATGTVTPHAGAGRNWQIFHVRSGSFEPETAHQPATQAAAPDAAQPEPAPEALPAHEAEDQGETGNEPSDFSATAPSKQQS